MPRHTTADEDGAEVRRRDRAAVEPHVGRDCPHIEPPDPACPGGDRTTEAVGSARDVLSDPQAANALHCIDRAAAQAAAPDDRAIDAGGADAAGRLHPAAVVLGSAEHTSSHDELPDTGAACEERATREPTTPCDRATDADVVDRRGTRDRAADIPHATHDAADSQRADRSRGGSDLATRVPCAAQDQPRDRQASDRRGRDAVEGVDSDDGSSDRRLVDRARHTDRRPRDVAADLERAEAARDGGHRIGRPRGRSKQADRVGGEAIDPTGRGVCVAHRNFCQVAADDDGTKIVRREDLADMHQSVATGAGWSRGDPEPRPGEDRQ